MMSGEEVALPCCVDGDDGDAADAALPNSCKGHQGAKDDSGIWGGDDLDSLFAAELGEEDAEADHAQVDGEEPAHAQQEQQGNDDIGRVYDEAEEGDEAEGNDEAEAVQQQVLALQEQLALLQKRLNKMDGKGGGKRKKLQPDPQQILAKKADTRAKDVSRSNNQRGSSVAANPVKVKRTPSHVQDSLRKGAKQAKPKASATASIANLMVATPSLSQGQAEVADDDDPKRKHRPTLGLRRSASHSDASSMPVARKLDDSGEQRAKKPKVVFQAPIVGTPRVRPSQHAVAATARKNAQATATRSAKDSVNPNVVLQQASEEPNTNLKIHDWYTTPEDYARKTSFYSYLALKNARHQIGRECPSGKPYVVIGVLAAKSPTKQSRNGSSFSFWTITDLDSAAMKLYVGGLVFQKHWKTLVGTVLALTGPNMMPEKPGSEPSFVVNEARQIIAVGKAETFSTCKSLKKDGTKCTVPVNTDKGEYCLRHINQKYNELKRGSRKAPRQVLAAGRQTPTTAVAPRGRYEQLERQRMQERKLGYQGNPKPMKSQALLQRESMARVGAIHAREHKVEKTIKLPTRYTSASESSSSAASTSLPRQPSPAGEKQSSSDARRHSAGTARIENPYKNFTSLRTVASGKKSKESASTTKASGRGGLLNTVRATVARTQINNLPSNGVGMRIVRNMKDPLSRSIVAEERERNLERRECGEFLVRHSVRPDTKIASVQNVTPSVNQLLSISKTTKPKLGRGASSHGTIELSSLKSLDGLSKAAELARKLKGRANKIDPNHTGFLSKDERQKKMSDYEAFKKERVQKEREKAHGLNAVVGQLTDVERQALRASKSRYHDELVEAERNELLNSIDKSIAVEKMEDVMKDVTEMKVTCFSCAKCRKVTQSKPQYCVERNHVLTRVTTMKRFFRCLKCSYHTSVLGALLPKRSCKKCGSNTWKKAGMLKSTGEKTKAGHMRAYIAEEPWNNDSTT